MRAEIIMAKQWKHRLIDVITLHPGAHVASVLHVPQETFGGGELGRSPGFHLSRVCRRRDKGSGAQKFNNESIDWLSPRISALQVQLFFLVFNVAINASTTPFRFNVGSGITRPLRGRRLPSQSRVPAVPRLLSPRRTSAAA